MKRLCSLLAAVAAAVVLAVPAGGSTGVPYNNEGGGGGTTATGYYVARVWVPYGGYWHWANCGYFVFPWGVVFDKCW